MKLYLHYEGNPPFTTIFHSDDPSTTVAHLLTDFVAAHAQSGASSGLNPTSLTVKNRKGAVVEPGKRVGKAFKDREDVFVEGPVTERKVEGSQGECSEKKVEEKKTKELSATQKTLVTSLIAQGEELEGKGRLRAAVACFEQVFTISIGNKASLLHLLHLWLKVGRPLAATDWCLEAQRYHSGDPAVLKAVGDIKFACGKHGEALGMFNKAIETLQKTKEHERPIDIKDVKLSAAKVMYKMGGNYEHLATKLVMEVVEPDNSHVGGLLEYAKIAHDRGRFVDAAQVLLRVIWKMEDSEEAKKYLALTLETDEGLQAVFSELKEGSGFGSAYAFLAGKVKDGGAIRAALELYERAVKAEPQNPSFCLNYVHTLEIAQDYKGVFSSARIFCNDCQEQLGSDLELREVVRALTEIEELYLDNVRMSYGKELWESSMTLRHTDEDVEDMVHKVEFSRSQLDLLALIFTVMKALFVSGALPRAAKLVHLVELARKASIKELHTTIIRNEAAYFGCISQILFEHPPPSIAPDQSWKPLYLCGDSHCLSGCKIWHLRDEGYFYPKRNFESAVKSLPEGAQVIMMFGEIDCREGILLAVEKCKYDSQDDALNTTVNIYVKLLRRLISEHKFEIFVHPISPVLDITRPVVAAFMKRLERVVQDTIEKHSLQGQLHWLDFFSELLTTDGAGLNPEIVFDGTHMSPKYIKYLRDSLGKIG